MAETRNFTYGWWARGDLNAFVALALNNLSDLVILSSLLVQVYGFPAEIVLYRMIPGTALGVLAGNLYYSWLAYRLARRQGRQDVCAMPFGINTPTVFLMIFAVMGPLFAATGDGEHVWRVAVAVTIMVGLFKLLVAPLGNRIRASIPRAGLLGSLAGAGLILIAFLPLMQLFQDPLVGFVSLALLLLTFLARVRLPWGVPGGFAAVLAGCLIFWGLREWGYQSPLLNPSRTGVGEIHLALPGLVLPDLGTFWEALPYLPLVLPFALGTIVGAIDNTESAAAAGDEYSANQVLYTEGAATALAGLLGGVVENTPYIGHPAYKEMGARAGYTVGTALFVGLGAVLGVFPLLVAAVPVAAVAPILIYIGLQITAQAFQATPARHGPAVALAMVPTLALLVTMQMGPLLESLGVSLEQLPPEAALSYRTLLVLGNGAIVTALLWGAATAELIDRRILRSAVYFWTGALFSLLGIMHSPFPRSELFLPWQRSTDIPFHVAGAYVAAGLLLAAFALAREAGRREGPRGRQ